MSSVNNNPTPSKVTITLEYDDTARTGPSKANGPEQQLNSDTKNEILALLDGPTKQRRDDAAAKTLRNNFKLFDNGAGGARSNDGLASRGEIRAGQKKAEELSADLEHVNNKPDLFRDMDTYAYGRSADEKVSKADLDSWLKSPPANATARDKEAVRNMRDNFDQLAGKDGLISIGEAKAGQAKYDEIATDAKHLLNSDELYRNLDTQQNGGEADDIIGAGDADRYAKNRASAGQPKSTPSNQASEARRDYEAVKNVRDNFDLIDDAAGKHLFGKDGLAAKHDLKAANQQFGQLATDLEYLKNNPKLFRDIDTYQNGGEPDGLLGKGDLDSWLKDPPANASARDIEAVRNIRDNFDKVDNVAGLSRGNDGLIGIDDVQAGQEKFGQLSADTKRLMDNPKLFGEVDASNGERFRETFGDVKNGLFGRRNLDSWMKQNSPA